MSAFILVFAHRYFAVTDDDGRYRIDGVPPGTYTLVVWNETDPRRSAASGPSPSARPAATWTRTSPSDERLLVAHQPDLLRDGAARRAVDGRRDLHRQPRRDAARPSASCSAASTKRRRWSSSTASSQFETFGREARLIADLPVLKAAVDTQDPATVEPIARSTRASSPTPISSPIADNRGRVLARLGTERRARRGAGRRGDHRPDRAAAERDAFWPRAARHPADQVGPDLDRQAPARRARHADPRREPRLAQANRFKELTNSEIAFGVNGIDQGGDAARSDVAGAGPLLATPGRRRRASRSNGEEYLAFANPLGPAGPRGQPIGDRPALAGRAAAVPDAAAHAAGPHRGRGGPGRPSSSATRSRARSRGRSERSPRRCARWRRAAT